MHPILIHFSLCKNAHSASLIKLTRTRNYVPESIPSSNAGKKIRLPSLPPHMYRLFSGNLIGCVGYSITRVSLIYHLVGDWQPDAPFCIVCSRGERASFAPTCSSEFCWASCRAFVRENSCNPATTSTRKLLFVAL